MPNVVPFFWRDGRVVYDTESKADVSDEYLRGMIRLLDPIIPKKLTDKLEYFYTAYGYSCNDRTDTFLADLETDTMYLPRIEEDTELPLAYALREYDLFCVVMPSELVDDTDNLDEAIMSETSHIHEEAYGEEDEDEDSEEDEEDTDDEEDEIEDDDDSDEEEADKKPAALN